MSKIKDKLIGIYEVKAKRDKAGNEVKVKRYIHNRNRLHAYVRELSEKEKFAAKQAGAETSILFRLNYNKRVRAGQFIEFRGDTYIIVSVDSFDYTLAALEGNSLKKADTLRHTAGTGLQVVVVNYESAWRLEQEIQKWRPDMIVCDESSKIKKGQQIALSTSLIHRFYQS